MNMLIKQRFEVAVYALFTTTLSNYSATLRSTGMRALRRARR